MEVDVKIHKGYAEWEILREKGGYSITQLFGKYQFICSSKKGKISIIQCKNYLTDGDDFWEIYCLEGNLFGDVMRFDTYQEAMNKAKSYLGD